MAFSTNLSLGGTPIFLSLGLIFLIGKQVNRKDNSHGDAERLYLEILKCGINVPLRRITYSQA